MPSPSAAAWRAFGGRYVIALVVAIAITATGVATVNREIDSTVASIERVKVTVAPPPAEGANYLLIGSDTRAGDICANPIDADAFCDPNADNGGVNSDTMMVAHIEPGAKSALVVSFPRDLTVEVPNSGGQLAKINSFYGSGGPDAIVEMLQYNFGIPIHHYAEVDFNTFREVVNAIGTVNVWFDHPTRDEYTGLAEDQGCQALDGDAALHYVRSRYMEQYIDGGWQYVGQDAPDIHRIERQQDFIRKLLGVAISRSLGNPFVALDLADNALSYTKVDTGIGRDQVNELVNAFRTVDVNDPSAVRFETIPVAVGPTTAALGSTLVLGDGAQDMIDQLRTFGAQPPPPTTVTPDQVHVQVVDSYRRKASDTRAPAVADTLRQYGFHATSTIDKDARSFLSDVRYGPSQVAAAKLLASYVPDAVLTADPTLGDRIVLVLAGSFDGIVVPELVTAPPADPSTTLGPDETTTTAAPTTTTLAPSTTTTTLPVDPARAACS